MRSAILIAAVLISAAIKPELDLDQDTVRVIGWVIVIFFLMDIIELISGCFRREK